MKPDPRSAEFITLIDRWLDQTATAEEAARLWQAVAECPHCAAALAAASRFESLLAEAVSERASEMKMLAPAVRSIDQKETQAAQRPLRQGTAQGPWSAKTRRWVGAAAAVLVAGLVSVYFWNEAGFERPPVIVHELVGPIQQPPLKLPKASNRTVGSEAPKITESAAQEPKELLTVHLDRFFLTGVSLDNIPLSRAIGILQGQLNEVNRDAALALDQLRVLVPTGASQRRITFHSGPIPFLKAVRAVAALAGCEVEVSEPQITITIQQSIYPELVKKRVLSDMLAGRLNAGGSPSISDPDRLAALRADAESLGVKPAIDGSVAITRGQWEALKMLTETRDLLGRLPMPSYAIYAVPGNNQPASNRVLTAKEVDEERKKIVAAKSVPLIIFTPQLASPTNRAPIQFLPYGDTVSLTLNPAYDPGADRRQSMGPQPRPDPDPVLVATGEIVEGGGESGGPTILFSPLGQIVGAATINTYGDVLGKGGNVQFGLSDTYTYTGSTTVQSGVLAFDNSGSNIVARTAGLNSNSTITVQGNVSAETMARINQFAASTGATLIVVPVTPPPPAEP